MRKEPGSAFREHFGRIRVVDVIQNKICPFLGQGIYIYISHFFMKHSWTYSFNL